MTWNKNATRYYSGKQEKVVANKLKGRCQNNSGATTFQKGDIIAGDWIIECKTKTSESKSFGIKKEWLDKIKEEAISMNKYHSALCFDYGDSGERYYVITEREFKRFLAYDKEENDGDISSKI